MAAQRGIAGDQRPAGLIGDGDFVDRGRVTERGIGREFSALLPSRAFCTYSRKSAGLSELSVSPRSAAYFQRAIAGYQRLVGDELGALVRVADHFIGQPRHE